ncbi:MAG: flagellar protein FliT [Thiotrichales bacterium]|nr:flagellar protein FliT [Thiotrichales bacterium]
MDNQVVQCLHHSKLMLMHAENQEWEEFIELHPVWEEEISKCFVDIAPQEAAEALANILVELIADVDKIQGLIKSRMSEIESNFSRVIQQQKAMNSYLK